MCIWSVDFLNAFLTWHSGVFITLFFFIFLLTACSKGHFGNNCNDTCDGCISELCNRSDGVCDIKDQCKAGWHGVKCDTLEYNQHVGGSIL
jgi:hypothetical protein